MEHFSNHTEEQIPEINKEVERAIISKAVDFERNTFGYAALGQIGDEVLLSVLDAGLLGTTIRKSRDDERQESGEERKVNWYKSVKEDKDGVVHFNIHNRGVTKINNPAGDFWIRRNPGGVTVLFSIDTYKELDPTLSSRDFDQKNRTYRLHSDYWRLSDEHFEKYKVWKNAGFPTERSILMGGPHRVIDAEFGYLLSHRVAPRNFIGLVIDQPNKVQHIINLMIQVYGNDSLLLVPIYNLDGDLLWPRQMTREEVGKMIDKEQKNII